MRTQETRERLLRDLDVRIRATGRQLSATRPTDKGRISYLRGKIDAYEQLRVSLQEQRAGSVSR